MAILENCTFCYCKIQKPVPGLNEGDSEFTVDAVVEKSVAKIWNAEHPKNKVRVIDTDDFETKYKIPPPHPEQDSQYIIKFKKIHAKKGVEMPEKYRPRVFQTIKGKPVDVTFDVLPANGSTGKVSYSTFNGSEKFPGVFVQLDAILVEDLIKYEDSAEGSNVAIPGSDFGATELAVVPDTAKKVVKRQTDVDSDEEPPESAKRAAAVAGKPAKAKKPASNFNDMDDDIPF